jgi:hypothetical protein
MLTVWSIARYQIGKATQTARGARGQAPRLLVVGAGCQGGEYDGGLDRPES